MVRNEWIVNETRVIAKRQYKNYLLRILCIHSQQLWQLTVSSYARIKLNHFIAHKTGHPEIDARFCYDLILWNANHQTDSVTNFRCVSVSQSHKTVEFKFKCWIFFPTTRLFVCFVVDLLNSIESKPVDCVCIHCFGQFSVTNKIDP